jgi:hypothetical protein
MARPLPGNCWRRWMPRLKRGMTNMRLLIRETAPHAAGYNLARLRQPQGRSSSRGRQTSSSAANKHSAEPLVQGPRVLPYEASVRTCRNRGTNQTSSTVVPEGGLAASPPPLVISLLAALKQSRPTRPDTPQQTVAVTDTPHGPPRAPHLLACFYRPVVLCSISDRQGEIHRCSIGNS